MQAFDDKLSEIASLKDSILAMVSTPSIHLAGHSSHPNPPASASNTPLIHLGTPKDPLTYITDPKNKTNGTLSILPKQHDSFPSGHAIMQDLLQKRLSYSSAVVRQVRAKKSHLEIVCRTAWPSQETSGKTLQSIPIQCN